MFCYKTDYGINNQKKKKNLRRYELLILRNKVYYFQKQLRFIILFVVLNFEK